MKLWPWLANFCSWESFWILDFSSNHQQCAQVSSQKIMQPGTVFESMLVYCYCTCQLKRLLYLEIDAVVKRFVRRFLLGHINKTCFYELKVNVFQLSICFGCFDYKQNQAQKFLRLCLSIEVSALHIWSKIIFAAFCQMQCLVNESDSINLFNEVGAYFECYKEYNVEFCNLANRVTYSICRMARDCHHCWVWDLCDNAPYG